MEIIYETFIISRPSACKHLNDLTSTHALEKHLTHTQKIGLSLNRSSNLSSLLIVPVNRLAKYAFYLEKIYEHTHTGHPDKRGVSEVLDGVSGIIQTITRERDRIEVVHDVLRSNMGYDKSWIFDKLSFVKYASATTMHTKRITTTRDTNDGRLRVTQADDLEKLKLYEKILMTFAVDVTACQWTRTVRISLTHIRAWVTNYVAMDR